MGRHCVEISEDFVWSPPAQKFDLADIDVTQSSDVAPLASSKRAGMSVRSCQVVVSQRAGDR